LLFHEFADSATIFSSSNIFLNHIRASGNQLVISGYLINSYHFQTSEVTTSFWKLQLSIIAQLRLILSLSVIVAIVIPDHDGRSVQTFIKGLKAAYWKVTSRVGIILQHRQQHSGLLYHHYCNSFILCINCQPNHFENPASDDTTTNQCIHLGAFQQT
jgi:hypothetical protein